jgi:hypothetical protein
MNWLSLTNGGLIIFDWCDYVCQVCSITRPVGKGSIFPPTVPSGSVLGSYRFIPDEAVGFTTDLRCNKLTSHPTSADRLRNIGSSVQADLTHCCLKRVRI